jgi:hypothetical protein
MEVTVHQAKIVSFMALASAAMQAPEHLSLDAAIQVARRQLQDSMDSSQLLEAERILRSQQ